MDTKMTEPVSLTRRNKSSPSTRRRNSKRKTSFLESKKKNENTESKKQTENKEHEKQTENKEPDKQTEIMSAGSLKVCDLKTHMKGKEKTMEQLEENNGRYHACDICGKEFGSKFVSEPTQ